MKVLLLLPLRMDAVDSKDQSHTSQQKDCRKKNSPLKNLENIRGRSSIGRAPPLQGGG